MNKIRISLIIHKLVFEGDFPQKNDFITEWVFTSDNVDKTSLVNLYTNVINSTSIGWSSYDMEVTETETRLAIVPTFFVQSIDDEYSESEESLIISVKNIIEEFVNINKSNNSIHNSNDVNDTQDYNVFIYSYPGSSDSYEFQDFINQLKLEKVPFKIEYERSQQSDQGASGGLYEGIIYIVDTITAGVVYDLIKKMPGLKIIPNLRKNRIETLKKRAAECLDTLPENLELIQISEMNNDNKQMQLVFRFKRKDYNFVFDMNNNITSFIQK